MNKIRTKFILILLFSIILPVVPSYFLVNSLVHQSLEIGLNKNVELALDDAASFSRELYSIHKEKSMEIANSILENKLLIHSLVSNKPDIQLLTELAEKWGIGEIKIYNTKYKPVFNNFFINPDSLLQIQPDASIINEIITTQKTGFYNISNPKFIMVYLPVQLDSLFSGSIFITRILDDEFAQAARHIINVNQMFKRLDFISNDIKRGLLLSFLIVYVPLTALLLFSGYNFIKKLTSPLLELVEGTKIIADGNWDYRVQATSSDEVGQLISAFNNMILTIKEKQNQARVEEEKRRKIEAENIRKTRDLEISELRTKALQEENKRKNIELEKAQELEKAYQALEESHRELRDTQAQLIQSGKMASLGNLAAGVAHEINNPVGAINSAADVTLRAVEKMSKFLNSDMSLEEMKQQKDFNTSYSVIQSNTRLIVEASKRVVKIVKSLKTFARLDEADYSKADIHEGLDSTLMLLQHEFKNRITIAKDYGKVPPLPCYSDELNQVFMNVLSNAAQAIENEGIIKLKTYYTDNKVYIEISDTGKGIEPQNLSRIFDPGFTTKGVGVGTGLGLSISYKIIEKHKGQIKVESWPGKGSVFTLELPLNEI